MNNKIDLTKDQSLISMTDNSITDPILPITTAEINSASDIFQNTSFNPPNSRQVLRIALNLKYLIDKVIPIVYDTDSILCEHSRILNANVVKLVKDACGGNSDDEKSFKKYKAVLVFALLKVAGWYDDLSSQELHNAELFDLRSTVAQQLCKILIEDEEKNDLNFMMMHMLLHRYVINENDIDSEPTNAVELATDMHYSIVIGSSGFQRCLQWLWRGWIIQSRQDPTTFVKENCISSLSFSRHFTPERIKTPQYQNIIQLWFSVIYLIIYSFVVNGKDTTVSEPIDIFEWFLYFFTIGYILDEISKFYYIGWAYLQFWNCFNDTLYLIVSISMSLRFISVSPLQTKYTREEWDMVSYRILSCAAPLIWSRLLLYLESERFVGAMLVVLKHMMKESLIFFVLLALIMIGFLQGFLGLDSADGKREITGPILTNLIVTVLGSGSFDIFERFAPPYAAILYYGYCFIISTILLNILIALYSNAYQKVVDNADDEFMTLMSQKTLRFIRAPDEDVFVPPLNLIEIIMFPIIKILPKPWSGDITKFLMTIMYSPILLYVSIKEVRIARRVQYNRLKKLEDDANELDYVWDLTDGYLDNDDQYQDDTATSTSQSNGNNDGINHLSYATTMKNMNSIRLQREAETSDPKFGIRKNWYDEVNESVQPVEKGYNNGFGWENFGIFDTLRKKCEESDRKIDNLQKDISILTELIKELKLKDKKSD